MVMIMSTQSPDAGSHIPETEVLPSTTAKTTSLFPESLKLDEKSLLGHRPPRQKIVLSLTALIFSLLALLCSMFVAYSMMNPPGISPGFNINVDKNLSGTPDSENIKHSETTENKKLKISLDEQKISQGDRSLKRDHGRWTLSFRDTSISFGKKHQQPKKPNEAVVLESPLNKTEVHDSSKMTINFKPEVLQVDEQLMLDQHENKMKYGFLGLCSFLFIGSILTAISQHLEQQTTYTIINVVLLSFAVVSLYLMIVMSVLLIMISILPIVIILLVLASVLNSGGIDLNFG
jgi:hypothetical protein